MAIWYDFSLDGQSMKFQIAMSSLVNRMKNPRKRSMRYTVPLWTYHVYHIAVVFFDTVESERYSDLKKPASSDLEYLAF